MPTMRRVRALAAHIRPVIRRVDACAAVPSAPAWLYRQGDRVVVWGNKGSDAPRVGVIVQCRRIRTVKDGYVGRLPMYDVRIVSTVLQCVSPVPWHRAWIGFTRANTFACCAGHAASSAARSPGSTVTTAMRRPSGTTYGQRTGRCTWPCVAKGSRRRWCNKNTTVVYVRRPWMTMDDHGRRHGLGPRDHGRPPR